MPLHVWIIITMETHCISAQTNKLPPKNYCSVSPKALPSSLSHWYYFHPRFLYFCLRLKHAAVIYFLLEIHYLVVAGALWMVGVGLINSDSLLPPTPHSSPPQLVQKDCACLCVCVWLLMWSPAFRRKLCETKHHRDLCLFEDEHSLYQDHVIRKLNSLSPSHNHTCTKTDTQNQIILPQSSF